MPPQHGKRTFKDIGYKMNITVLFTGKTSFKYLKEGLEIYEERLKHYISFRKIELPDIRNSSSISQEQVKEKEGDIILEHIKPGDTVVLLDQRGKKLTSEGFAKELEKKILSGTKNLIFVIGGAYGFSEAVYQRAGSMLSLSDMTFSHQMVRLIFVEQLYRAMSILNGSPYHHE